MYIDMEVLKLRTYIVFVVAVVNFDWLKNTISYVSCIPPDKRIAMNKDKLKAVFGSDNVPQPSIFASIGRDTLSAKKYMISLYKYTTEKSYEERFTNQSAIDKADTVVSFVNHAYPPRPNASDEDGAMFFDVQSLLNFVIESTLKSELRIYLDATKKILTDTSLKITIYQIIIPRKEYYVITASVINASFSDWHDFDILEATLTWKEDETVNNGILVVCQSTEDKKVYTMAECGLVDFKGGLQNRPFLVSFYESGDEDELLAEQLPKSDDDEDDEDEDGAMQQRLINANVRTRRSSFHSLFPHASDDFPRYTLGHNEHPSNTTCVKQSLYVRFQDLGWSGLIIAPDGYEAAYCRGDCPFPLHDNMNASNHAIIQTLVHLIKPDIPQPCCSPIRLSPLEVLFYDDNDNIVMKKYANMVVNDCGCQ